MDHILNGIDLESISYQLLIDGYSVINPTFTKKNLDILPDLKNSSNKLRESSSEKFEKDYKGGFCKIITNKQINDSEYIFFSLYNSFCLKIIKSLGMDDLEFNSMYQTIDTKKSKHIAQTPHFDRIPALKFMLYLNDLNFVNGAFQLSKGSHHWVNQKLSKSRPKHGSNGYLELTRKIPNYFLNNLKPINGKAGTIIIFYTDVIHNQGLVKDGCCQILRSHYWKKSTLYNKFRAKFS